jgi:hypothetical protein
MCMSILFLHPTLCQLYNYKHNVGRYANYDINEKQTKTIINEANIQLFGQLNFLTNSMLIAWLAVFSI